MQSTACEIDLIDCLATHVADKVAARLTPIQVASITEQLEAFNQAPRHTRSTLWRRRRREFLSRLFKL